MTSPYPSSIPAPPSKPTIPSVTETHSTISAPPPRNTEVSVRVYSVKRADVLAVFTVTAIVIFMWTFAYHAARYAAGAVLGVHL